MSVTLLHLVTEKTSEDGLRDLSLLLRHLPRDRVDQRVVVIGPPGPSLEVPPDISWHRIGGGFGCVALQSLAIRREVARYRADMLYAWGAEAAMMTPCGRGGERICALVHDPAEARMLASRWSAGRLTAGLFFICSSELAREHLTGQGVPACEAKLIRPGVDIQVFQRVDGAAIRERMGLLDRHRVLVMPSPPTRAGGHFAGLWASAILFQVQRNIRLIIPGISREQRRLRRLTDRKHFDGLALFTGYALSIAELLAVADALLVPAEDEASPGWIVRAMAASVPMIASPVPAVKEWIVPGENGFFYQPGEPHMLATCIRQTLDDPDAMRRCAAAGFRRAAKEFCLDRLLEDHLRLLAVGGMETSR